MPRTTILTADLTAAIVALVEKGVDPGAAGEALDVSRATVNEWIRRGEGRDDRPGGERYATFATEIRAAEARILSKVVGAWTGAAISGDWRAGAAWAARRFPYEWGEKTPVSVGRRVTPGPPLSLQQVVAMARGDDHGPTMSLPSLGAASETRHG